MADAWGLACVCEVFEKCECLFCSIRVIRLHTVVAPSYGDSRRFPTCGMLWLHFRSFGSTSQYPHFSLQDDDGTEMPTEMPTSALFGDDDDEQHLQLEDEEEERPQQQEIVPDSKEDRRAALLALARQKRTADTEEGSSRDKKKRKKEKGSKKDGAGERRASRRDGRPRRQKPAEASRPARPAGGPEEEIASDELEESEEDKEFIDDEGES